jgi:hypothetical protein
VETGAGNTVMVPGVISLLALVLALFTLSGLHQLSATSTGQAMNREMAVALLCWAWGLGALLITRLYLLFEGYFRRNREG